MKGPHWADDGLFEERQRQENERLQAEWKKRFIEEFGQDAYLFLKRVRLIVEVDEIAKDD